MRKQRQPRPGEYVDPQPVGVDVAGDESALELLTPQSLQHLIADYVRDLEPVADSFKLGRHLSEILTPVVERDLRYMQRGGKPAPRRRWRVYCTEFASCRWAGYRQADTREQAVAKRCPRCGKQVTS